MTSRVAMPPNLLPQPTTFIGRGVELEDLAQLLANPGCRLITVIGPGGCGKTRLALEAANRHREDFADGAAFVALQEVPSADEIAAAVAAAVGVPLSNQDEPRTQLLHALSHRHLLLVLDNFEHLLDGAALLSDVLTTAPHVRLLVTSREALHLQEEWRYPLFGLPVPNDAHGSDLQRWDAIRLFTERAQRVRPDFSLATEREGVVRVCRLVEGLPLAIELAASWTATLASAAIATEIEQDLAVLATNLRNVPERHRSMRVVFESSFRLLNDDERAVFSRLAVFRGGFRREAAAAVAGATLPVLSELVAKSLLWYETNGRYHLHELARQFAAAQLAADPVEEDNARDRHGDFYIEFLATRARAMAGGAQREATSEIGFEWENVRVAWQRALDRGAVDGVVRALDPLCAFALFRGRYQDGITHVEATVHRLRDMQPELKVKRALSITLLTVGLLYIRVGRLEDARRVFEEACTCSNLFDDPLPPGLATDPDFAFGLLALIEGDYAVAIHLGEKVCHRAEAEDHGENLTCGWYLLTQAAMAQGDDDVAWEAAKKTLASAQRGGDDWFLAYCHLDLGTISTSRGKYAEAREHYQRSFALREEFADPQGMAIALIHLAKLATLQGAHSEARELYTRSLKIYQKIGDRGGLAAAHRGLGVTAATDGDLNSARHHFEHALSITSDMQFITLMLSIIVDSASLLLQLGQTELAAELLTFARDHPSSDHETRDWAVDLLTRAEPMLPTDSFAIKSEGDRATDFASVVARVQAELSAHVVAQPEQPLVEPLTERELSVLRLIAAGHSNQQIADELFLTVSTVKWYGGQIFGKLLVRNRTEAVARARELHLLG